MILKTKIAVTHLDVTKLATGGSRDGIVEMLIGKRNMVITPTQEGEYVSAEVTYGYFDDAKKQLPTDDNGVFIVSDSAPNDLGVMNGIGYVSGLSDSVSSLVTAGKNLINIYDSNVLQFAKIKFAERYGIAISDIEVVN